MLEAQIILYTKYAHTVFPTESPINFYQNKRRHISDAPTVMTQRLAISLSNENHMDSTDELFEPNVFTSAMAAQRERDSQSQDTSCSTNRKQGH